MDELVVDFLKFILLKRFNNLDGYKKLFVASYLQGLNNEEPSLSASVDYLIRNRSWDNNNRST